MLIYQRVVFFLGDPSHHWKVESYKQIIKTQHGMCLPLWSRHAQASCLNHGTVYLVWTCPLTDFMDPAVLGLNTSPHCFGYPSCHMKPIKSINQRLGIFACFQDLNQDRSEGIFVAYIRIPWFRNQRIRLQRRFRAIAWSPHLIWVNEIIIH